MGVNFSTLTSRYQVYDKMRSRKYQDRVQEESTKLPRGSTAAKKISTKTGVNVMDLEAPRPPIIDLITKGESA